MAYIEPQTGLCQMFKEVPKQLVFIGSDHAGFKAKEELKPYLVLEGFEVTDLGCFSEDPCDYPDIAREVSEKVIEHNGDSAFGILICGSGNGVAIAANRYKDIRAGVAVNERMAEMTRKHNNANVLTMGARDIDVEMMKRVAKKFLTTEFESNEERHVRRVEKLNTMGE